VLIHNSGTGRRYAGQRHRIGIIFCVGGGFACGIYWSCPIEPGCDADGITRSVGLAFGFGSAGPGVCAHEH
jgi:hypothetical protein